jgi:hypothetical protein
VVTHPIRVAYDSYRGNQERRRIKCDRHNALALKLEQHINDLLLNQQEAISQYLYHDIARVFSVPVDTVRNICFVIDGGHNGFTALRKGLTLDQAMQEMDGASRAVAS